MTQGVKKPTSTRHVFRIPLLLGVVSGAGLIAALLVEGSLDLVFGALIAAPVVVILWKVARQAVFLRR